MGYGLLGNFKAPSQEGLAEERERKLNGSHKPFGFPVYRAVLRYMYGP